MFTDHCETNRFFVHPQGICETESVGDDTKIWAFSHVLSGAQIGSACNVCDHVFIENDVQIGHRVTIKCGVQLWDGLRVDDDVFIGPNATFVNDLFPRSKKYPAAYLQTHICRGASIGSNATILGGITIGEEAMVGAGAVVTQNVPPRAIVVGNPAKITGYANTLQVHDLQALSGHLVNDVDDSPRSIIPLQIGAAAIYPIHNYQDLRGSLSVTDFAKDLPFIPKRQFFVYGVPTYKVRGEHAHFECEQFLIALHGSLSVVVDNGIQSKEVRLESPSIGLYLPKMIWGIQYKFSPDAVLAVFASQPYDSQDYIRSYSDFLEQVNGGGQDA